MNKKISLFIIDDRDIIRDSIRIYFSNVNDIEIVGEADNGEEALENLKHVNPDVILTDISMPFMNGFDVVKWLRSKKPNARILVMSINDQDHYVLKMCKLGVNGYFLKDDNLKKLPDAIRKIYNGSYFLSEKIKYSVLTEEYLVKAYLLPNALNRSKSGIQRASR